MLLAICSFAFALSGCGGDSARSDMVVAILLKCEITTVRGGVISMGVEATGPRCSEINADGSPAERYVRKQLTVRTPAGTTYFVEVEPSVDVKIGDPWPLAR